MATVFISYRRGDTEDIAWRLTDYLSQQGQDSFRDMESFGAGDFRESMREAIESSAVVIVLIGQRWLDELSNDGVRSPGQWVQTEVEMALATGTPIVPVLVHGSDMPKPDILPKTIRELAYQQAVSVRSDARFPSDARKICSMIDQLAPGRQRSAWWKRLAHRLARKLRSPEDA